MSNKNNQQKTSQTPKADTLGIKDEPQVTVEETNQQDAPKTVTPEQKPNNTPEPKVAPKEEVVDKPTTAVEEKKMELSKPAGAVGEPKTARGRFFFNILNEYIQETALNSGVTVEKGAQYTTAMIRFLTGPSISGSYEDFTDVMELFRLNILEHNEGVLGRKHIFRFIPDVSSVTSAQVRLYENLYAAMYQVSVVGRQQASKTTDIAKFSAYIETGRAIENIEQYFSA